MLLYIPIVVTIFLIFIMTLFIIHASVSVFSFSMLFLVKVREWRPMSCLKYIIEYNRTAKECYARMLVHPIDVNGLQIPL